MKIKSFLLIIFIIISLLPIKAFAKTEEEVHIYFFHSKTCSHCKEEEIILKKIEKNYQNVEVFRFEIHEEANIPIFEQAKRIYKIDTNAIPLTIIGDKVYLGYSNHKTLLNFIKTIEYYSIYPYQDRIREIIDKNYHSTIVVKQDIPTLKEFMKSYKSYSIFGIYTDDIDETTSAVLLGMSSSINLVSIASMIIVFFLLNKLGGTKNKILLLSFYLICKNILRMSSVFRIEIITYIILIALLLLFMIGLYQYNKNKRRQFIIMDIFIVISLIAEYLSKKLYSKNLNALKSISELHLLSGIEKVIYNCNYFISMMIVDILFILIIYLFFQKNLIKN